MTKTVQDYLAYESVELNRLTSEEPIFDDLGKINIPPKTLENANKPSINSQQEVSQIKNGAPFPLHCEQKLINNAEDIENEINWLEKVLEIRFLHYFKHEKTANIYDITPPDLRNSTSDYAKIVNENNFGFCERCAVILAVVPLLKPHKLDIFLTKNNAFNKRFSEFGGIIDTAQDCFIPTLETLFFVLAETNLHHRFSINQLFSKDHDFNKKCIFDLFNNDLDKKIINRKLQLNENYLNAFCIEIKTPIHLSSDFPAQHIETELDWHDLVLHQSTLTQVEDINTWVQHGSTLINEWGMGNRIRPGYRALFYGPPGTGKTMTACLLGKMTNKEVYKIDLSMVVSKYIGETEKNLAKVFDVAQNKGWILFFDEADALFGKRSDTQNSHDRYANQEVAFLLQRIETFDGIAILSSNLKDNIDDAFARRFESVVYFPIPKRNERLRIWQQAFSPKAELEETIDLDRLAKNFELTGGAIINIVRYASISAIKRGSHIITLDDIQRGIRREQRKEGKL